MWTRLLAAVALTLQLHSIAAASADARAVRGEIYPQIPSYLAFDPVGPNALQSIGLASTYYDTQTKYWDQTNQADRPACIVFPANAEHVSAAVKALNKKASVPFSIKSGGH